MMINLGRLAVSRTQEYFVVKNVEKINLNKLGIGRFSLGDHVFVVQFCEGDICYPNTELIGICGDGAGNRLYLWRNEFWSELDLCTFNLDGLQPECDSPIRRLLYKLPR